MATKQESKGKQEPKDKNQDVEAKQDKQHAAEVEEKETKAAKSDKNGATKAEAENDLDEGEELNALLAAFEGDLTDINPEEGIGLIDEWYDILHKSKDEGQKELAKNLKELKR